MKNIFHLLIFTFTLSFLNSFAQETEEQKTIYNKVRINDVYVISGFFSNHTTNGVLADFKALAQNSALLNRDFTGFNSGGRGYYFRGSDYSRGNLFSFQVGLNFSDKEKKFFKLNPQLRLGVSYFSGAQLSAQLNREIRVPYDTLTTSQGQIYYIDSVNSYSYYMNYNSEQVRVHASVIFRTKPESRWSVYAGAGITAGVSFNASTTIVYDHYQYSDGGIFYSYPWNNMNEYAEEQFRNNSGFAFSAFIPMGIDFRLGKKREFWKRIHLYYEFNPSINLASIPELRTYVNAQAVQGFGIRVSVR